MLLWYHSRPDLVFAVLYLVVIPIFFGFGRLRLNFLLPELSNNRHIVRFPWQTLSASQMTFLTSFSMMLNRLNSGIAVMDALRRIEVSLDAATTARMLAG